MLVILRGSAAMMSVTSRCGGLHLGGCTAAVVIGTAQHHGRGGNALRGNCQHQQPYQQRSDQHTHALLYRSAVTVRRLREQTDKWRPLAKASGVKLNTR